MGRYFLIIPSNVILGTLGHLVKINSVKRTAHIMEYVVEGYATVTPGSLGRFVTLNLAKMTARDMVHVIVEYVHVSLGIRTMTAE
jgi:hypothetical protein